MKLFWDSGSGQEGFKPSLAGEIAELCKDGANDDVFATGK